MSILDSWETCLEMITDRGFTIDKKITSLSKSDLKKKLISDTLHIIAYKQNGEILYLEYLLNNKKKSS